MYIFVHGSFLFKVFVVKFHNDNIIQLLRKGNCFFMNNSGKKKYVDNRERKCYSYTIYDIQPG